MIKYRVISWASRPSVEIEGIEVTRETSHYVTYTVNGVERREGKTGPACWFDTYDEALEYLDTRTSQYLSSAEAMLEGALALRQKWAMLQSTKDHK